MALEKLYGIQKGEYGEPTQDRGGYYSKDLNVWVESDLDTIVEALPEAEIPLLESFADLAVSIGKLHKMQLEDVSEYKIWPKEFFEEDGAEELLKVVDTNPFVADPYSCVTSPNTGIPYSHAYSEELKSTVAALSELSDTLQNIGSVGADLVPYIKSLTDAYSFEADRESDLQFMHEADMNWVKTSSDTKYLIFAEPTEVYQDPLRVEIASRQDVAAWASSVENLKFLPPWRNFFEFRLMSKEDSLLSPQEQNSIKACAKELFASTTFSDSSNVFASLEFRRLLIASGQGAFPAKTAKNYPNFTDIRDGVGYKNVIYTNMIEHGTATEVYPALEKYFPQDWVKAPDFLSALSKGRLLLVVAHEDNHPFCRISHTALEEAKATVNGFKTLCETGTFDDSILLSVLRSLIGGALSTKEKVQEARNFNDSNAYRAMEAYYVADTVILNFLLQRGGFVLSGEIITDINFAICVEIIADLSKVFVDINSGAMSIEPFLDNYNKETVWEKFEPIH